MKLKITLLVVGLAAAFALALSPVSPAAEGQTPDGETPAEEDICTAAGLSGAAWGLCNAYCEAMDCDGAPEASPEACAKVKANFEKKTGGKVALPCESFCNEVPPGLVLNGTDWAGTGDTNGAVLACVAEAGSQGCDVNAAVQGACKTALGADDNCRACIGVGDSGNCTKCGLILPLAMLDAKCKLVVKGCTK